MKLPNLVFYAESSFWWFFVFAVSGENDSSTLLSVFFSVLIWACLLSALVHYVALPFLDFLTLKLFSSLWQWCCQKFVFGFLEVTQSSEALGRFSFAEQKA